MSKLKVALQIGAIDKFIKEDPDGTLKYLKDIGYDYVEIGSYPEDAAAFKAMLDKYELGVISGHLGIENFEANPEKFIADCKIYGLKYFVNGYIDIWHLKGHPGEDEMREKLLASTKVFKENGIGFLHHNHTYEFHRHEGKFCFDWLIEEVSPELLHPQIDTGWVRFCGYDPAEMLKHYAGMVEVVHLKDFKSVKYSKDDEFIPLDQPKFDYDHSDTDESFTFTPIGYGVQDFEKIIKTAEELGTEMVVVEQDSSKEMSLLEAAKLSREYLLSLGI